MNALPGHAFIVVRMKEKGGGADQRGFNYSREPMVTFKIKIIPLL